MYNNKSREKELAVPNLAHDSLLQVRMNSKVRAKAEKIIRRAGLSSSEAVRMFMVQIVEEKKLPFLSEWSAHERSAHEPNVETIEAFEEIRRGGGEVVTLAEHRRRWDEA